uniref:Glutamate--tRNA ligase n=1 Tax=Eubacterium plexicaudatum ASF492 TaxID=1235802 RepID=N1ZZV1_9FIRM
MDYNKLAELIFPEIKDTIKDLEELFPERNLPKGAYVTRFAPSPTGYMHIGGLYAAMISSKLAKQTGGIFYLRIEDTDKKRELAGGVDEIIRSLGGYGIFFDEGPFPDGEKSYGPYKQSERKHIYQICVKELMRAGHAYPCFCTPEELDHVRQEQEKNKDDIGYYGTYASCRSLTYEQIEEKIKKKEPFVVRLKSPGDGKKHITYFDPIRGNIEMPENHMDLVLLKSDGIPTYHFAHVVDDHFMRTNLVVRGDEWMASYPIHKQMFELCGFHAPDYLHISPIMKMDGTAKRKLSKRKDPEAAVGYYLEEGFPIDSVKEYLLTIANSNYEEWHMANPNLTGEDFVLSMSKMPVSGALFDIDKLMSVSKEIIAESTIELCEQQILEWAEKYEPDLFEFANSHKDQFKNSIGLWKMSGKKVRKDVAKWSELMHMFDYLYKPQEKFEQTVAYEVDDKYSKEQMKEVIDIYKKDLFLDSQQWFEQMKQLGEQIGYCSNMKEYKKHPQDYKGSISDLCTIVRVAVTGHKNSPDLYTIMNIIGEQNVQRRLDHFLAHIF